MNDQPAAADSPITDAQRGPAVGGALAGAAVILLLAAVFVGVRSAGSAESAGPKTGGTASGTAPSPGAAVPEPPAARRTS